MSTTTTTNNGVSDIYTIVAPDGAKATVHSQGGHVTSWVGAEGDERLFMSPNAVYQAGKALRGGVPVIFPQFSDMGTGQTHGCVRSRQWKLQYNDGGEAALFIDIAECDTDFPLCACRLRLIVSVSDKELKLTAKVERKQGQFSHQLTPSDAEKAAFAFAFHTYFAVSDISAISLKGFEDDMPYADNLQNRKLIDFNSPNGAVAIRKISEEVDRIYTGVKNPLTIVDPSAKRDLVVFGVNLPDVVLWNPWVEKNARLSDLPQPDGYKRFVCIEHGALMPKIHFPAKMEEAFSWEGSQVIQCVKH